VWDVQQIHGPLLGRLTAAVIAGRRGDTGVAGELLHRGDVGARVQQIPDERAPQVVWTDRVG
jgi:hypothetical protein